MKEAGRKFLYLRKLSNEIRFRTKLKLSEKKTQAKSSYILTNSLQRNSI